MRGWWRRLLARRSRSHLRAPATVLEAQCRSPSPPGTSIRSGCGSVSCAASSPSIAPDVLCLQETKCPDANFPLEGVREAGYPHIEIHGQKGYHGVAIVSRLPLAAVDKRRFCGKDDARHIAATVSHGGRPITVHNLYIPAGGDEPDPEINPKFAHKLSFLDELHGCMAALATPALDAGRRPQRRAARDRRLVAQAAAAGRQPHAGRDRTAWSALRAAGGWVDLMRHFVPPEEKLFTWWSYRSPDWTVNDRGRRLDHIWATPDLAPEAVRLDVLRAARAWQRPSDHVPVIASFA